MSEEEKVLGEENTENVGNEESKEKTSYQEYLGSAMDFYEEDPGAPAYCDVLTALFDGIRNDECVPVPIVMHGDDIRMMTLGDSEEEPDRARKYVVMTDMEELKKYTFAGYKLRALIGNMVHFRSSTDRDAFLVINPNRKYPFEVSLDLFVSAMSGIRSWLEDMEDDSDGDSSDSGGQEMPEREPDSFSIEITCGRHMTEKQLERVGILMDGLRDKAYEHLVLNIAEEVCDSDGEPDSIEFIQVCRAFDGKYHLEIAYNMDDFNWKCPLILGTELEYDAAMEIIRQLCVEGIPSGDIEAIQHFRAIQVDDSDEDDEEEEDDENKEDI